MTPGSSRANQWLGHSEEDVRNGAKRTGFSNALSEIAYRLIALAGSNMAEIVKKSAATFLI